MRAAVVFAGLVLGAGAAEAQSCVGRPDFDACMAGILGQQQAANAAAQQRIFQQYLATYGPWLQQQYAQYRAQGGTLSFEQFAYWNLMTANGTNPGAALQAQRDWFAGQQQANRTLQQGYESYRQGMYDNSRRQSEAVERYSNEAIRGQAPYVDPYSGRTVMLPYAPAPNQPFTWGGETYVQDGAGTYHRLHGNAWVPLAPQR